MARGFFHHLLLLAVLLCAPMFPDAWAQSQQTVTLGGAKLKVRMPKGFLAAKPQAYLSHELLWYHPQGARITVASIEKDASDTLEAWLQRIRESARARKLSLRDPAAVKVAGNAATRITARSRTHEVQFVVFAHRNRMVLVQFSCELKNRSACPFAGDFEQVLGSFEPL